MEELNLVEIKSVPEEKKDEIEEERVRKTAAYIYNSLTDDERKVYKILSKEPLYIDDIFKMSGLVTAKASKAILNLELKSLIKELPGKNFVRKE